MISLAAASSGSASPFVGSFICCSSAVATVSVSGRSPTGEEVEASQSASPVESEQLEATAE